MPTKKKTQKQTIVIPTLLSDVTLGQYQELLNAQKELEDNNELYKRCFSILTGVPEEVVGTIKGDVVFTTCNNIFNLLRQEKYPLIHKFSLGDVQFGFIPDIEGSFSFDEYTDSGAYLGEYNEWHKLMAVLFRPIVEEHRTKYRIAEYIDTKKYSETMKLMPIDIVLGGVHFLAELGTVLLHAIPSYLEDQIANKEAQKHLETLGKDGETIKTTIHSLRETFSDLKKSGDLTLTPHLLT